MSEVIKMADKSYLQILNEVAQKDKAEGRSPVSLAGPASWFRTSHDVLPSRPDGVSFDDAQKAYSKAYDSAERPKSKGWSFFDDTPRGSTSADDEDDASGDTSSDEPDTYDPPSYTPSSYGGTSSGGSQYRVTAPEQENPWFANLLGAILVIGLFLLFVLGGMKPAEEKVPPVQQGSPISGGSGGGLTPKSAETGKARVQSTTPKSITLEPTTPGLYHLLAPLKSPLQGAYTDSVVIEIRHTHNRDTGEWLPGVGIIVRLDNGDIQPFFSQTKPSIAVGDRVRIVFLSRTALELYKLVVK